MGYNRVKVYLHKQEGIGYNVLPDGNKICFINTGCGQIVENFVYFGFQKIYRARLAKNVEKL